MAMYVAPQHKGPSNPSLSLYQVKSPTYKYRHNNGRHRYHSKTRNPRRSLKPCLPLLHLDIDVGRIVPPDRPVAHITPLALAHHHEARLDDLVLDKPS